jgi:hypothetical protein
MSAVEDVDELIRQYHLASSEFLKGNPEPVENLFSRREDVTLANPYCPPVMRGSRLLRAQSRPHRCAAMASSSAPRSYRSK